MKEDLLCGKMVVLMVASLFVAVNSHQSNDCTTGCQTCEVYYFFQYCTKCMANHYLDSWSGLCFCNPGSYALGDYCYQCSNSCLTCTQYACTSCTQDKILSSGSCLCKNGNGIDSDGDCTSPQSNNLAIILGIIFGGSFGFLCLVTAVIMIRKRNFRIHQQEDMPVAHHTHLNPIILQVHHQEFEDSSAYGTINQTASAKKHEFKAQTCSICLEEYPFFMTQCGHFFHETCITEWIKKRKHCPNCNHSITRMKIMKWCNICKQQLIPPQRYRLKTCRRPLQKDEIPIFWATCANCQYVEQQIDLKPIK